MKHVWQAWVLLLAWVGVGSLAAGQVSAYSVQITNAPALLVAGQKVVLDVQYAAPANGTTLHVEMKYLQPDAVIGHTEKALRGTGECRVDFVIPAAAAGRKLGFAVWMGENWQNPVGTIFRAPGLQAITASQAATLNRQAAAQQQIRTVFLARYGGAGNKGKLIGIYQNQAGETPAPPAAGKMPALQGAGGWPESIAAGLTTRLRAAGFAVTRLTNDELTNPAIMDGHVLPAVILVNATAIPAGAGTAIKHYVHSAGFLIALGGPIFSKPQFRVGKRWLSHSDMLEELKRIVQNQLLPLPRHAGQWKAVMNDRTKPFTVKMLRRSRQLPPGTANGTKFTFILNAWSGFQSPPVTVPSRSKLTVFWAKGDKNAHQLAVEWDENDGSRWIAVIALHTHWMRYVLPEAAFYAWPNPAVRGRYFPGDHLHLRQGRVIGFGLASTHTNEINGRYTIAVAGVGTAAIPARLSSVASLLTGHATVPAIDTISPGAYKLFPVTNMKTLAVNPRQVMAPQTELPMPASTLGIYPRAQAAGIDKDMATRYVPLLNCLDKNGRFTAVAAALVLPSTAASADQATTLSVPITDPAFFVAPATQQWLADVITRVRSGLYLAEGGTKEYACFAGTAMPLGAVVVNRGLAPQTVRVISEVTDSGGKRVFQHTFTTTVPEGGTQKLTTTWLPPAPSGWESVYRVMTTLEADLADHGGEAGGTPALQTGGRDARAPSGGQDARPPIDPADRLVGSLRVLGSQRQHHFVTTRNGLFILRGKPWCAYGVNFWPQSSGAQEIPLLYEQWPCREAYDPQTVMRNLRDMRAIGFNTLSISYEAGDDPWNLLDVLARARELGLKVNLSIAGIDGFAGASWAPGKFNFEPVKELIDQLHLASNDTLFAYDITWEPFWDNHAARQRLDAQWRAWIVKYYGSIEQAEAAWHFQAPRYKGQVTNPLEAQIKAGQSGPAAAMVLAYNRFLNELLHDTYAPARQLIHSVDAKHLVSFRMRIAGDPGVPGDMGYDFAGLGRAVDMFEPEGYGLMSTLRHVAGRAAFTIQYARAINPNLPVIYAEFGHSEWDRVKHADSPAIARTTAQIYAAFFHAILRAGGNGAICWWSLGGYRYGERSDYGIINPDRSWRPVTYVLHDYAARMTAPRPLPTPDVWIPIRLNHVRAERGIYQTAKKKFWAAYDAGKLPGLKVVN